MRSFFDTLGKSEINPPAADRFYTQWMRSFFDTLGKSEINPPAADRFYTQYSIIPPFHHSIRRLMATSTPLG
jgi:hypothetical protein